jgi:hypothetical protein
MTTELKAAAILAGLNGAVTRRGQDIVLAQFAKNYAEPFLRH